MDKIKKFALDESSAITLSDGTRLVQIVALKDIVTPEYTILKGSRGGYVESERNLSQNGNSWIGSKSIVRGNAFVCGDAVVHGKSEIWGEAYLSDKAIVRDTKVCGNVVIRGEGFFNGCSLSGKNSFINDNIHEYFCACDDEIISNETLYSEVFFENDSLEKQ